MLRQTVIDAGVKKGSSWKNTCEKAYIIWQEIDNWTKPIEKKWEYWR